MGLYSESSYGIESSLEPCEVCGEMMGVIGEEAFCSHCPNIRNEVTSFLAQCQELRCNFVEIQEPGTLN